jgi:sucrose phosphorylase
MIEDLQKEGALVNYKKNPDGTQSPYEINVTYLDALNLQSDDDEVRVKRFLAAHSILLALPGVPAIYVQSILGSRNDVEGVARTGMNRSINRQKYNMADIENELNNPDTLRNKVYTELTKIIAVRKEEALFHPNTKMEVLDLGEKVFAFKRVNVEGNSLLVIINLTNESVECDLTGSFFDTISGENINCDHSISLEPYQFVWLKPAD